MTSRKRSRFRFLPALLAVLAVAACGGETGKQAPPPLPDIPTFDTTGFLPVIRAQLDEASEKLEAQPYDPLRNGELGMMLAAYDQDAPAAALFERAHRLDSSEFRWPYYLGYARYDLGQLPEAIAAMQAALEIKPEHPNARIKLAEFFLENGELAKSQKLYTRIARDLPSRVEGHIGLGKLANLESESEQAIEHLKVALGIESRIGEIHFALSEAYRKLGETQAASRHLALFEQYRSNRPNPRDTEILAIGAMNVGDLPHVSRGLAHRRAGRHVDAARSFMKAVELNPENTVALTNLMELHGQNRELEAARDYYRLALKVNPADAELHYKWAEVLRRNRQTEEAERAYTKAMEVDAFNADYHAGLGRALQDAGKLAEAETSYRKSLELDATHAEASFYLAYLLAMRQDNAAAAGLLRPLVEGAERPSPATLQLLARVEAQMGEFRSALERLGRARGQLVDGQNPRLLQQVEADIEAVEAARDRAQR